MKVEIFDYGSDAKNYYVVYKVTGQNLKKKREFRGMLKGKLN